MDVQELSRWEYQVARYWRRGFFGLQSLAFGIGVTSSITHIFSEYSALIVASALIFAEICLWRHETSRLDAEHLRRRLDLYDSFGWKISSREIADLSAIYGPVNDSAKEKYFASIEPESARRAVENVREAAWWSKHLAKSCYRFTYFVFISLLACSLLFLIIAIKNSAEIKSLKEAAEFVIAALLLIGSFGLFRQFLGFERFSALSLGIETAATRLLEGADVTEIDATKLCYDYYFIRGESPMLFGWRYAGIKVFNMQLIPGRKGNLNKAWEAAYRTKAK